MINIYLFVKQKCLLLQRGESRKTVCLRSSMQFMAKPQTLKLVDAVISSSELTPKVQSSASKLNGIGLVLDFFKHV